MSNSFESLNIPLTEQEVIQVLEARELNSPESLEIISKYADQCHLEADIEARANPGSAETSNRANIKAEIKIASAALKVKKYKTQVAESLEQTLLAASQSETTADLAEQIQSILNDLE